MKHSRDFPQMDMVPLSWRLEHAFLHLIYYKTLATSHWNEISAKRTFNNILQNFDDKDKEKVQVSLGKKMNKWKGKAQNYDNWLKTL